jgi:UDP-GlcNAc:undecaprenyl-phosphate/decaprenyl-phosphate GlcNAc-1-phosphate transferase
MFTTICLICLVISYLASKFTIPLAQRLSLTDDPKYASSRKLQKTNVPLLGGLGFSLVAGAASVLGIMAMDFDWFGQGQRLSLNLSYNFRPEWIVVGGLIILIGGFLDDKYRLKAWQMLIPINLALFVVIFLGGLKIEALSYPFDQLIPKVSFLPSILAYIWVGLCLASTKFLDGHDGLVGSVGVLNLATIGLISLLPQVNQPLVFFLAFVWAFSIAGFLPFNLPNAKLYLGEIGSEMIGFVIGILSIISGAKVATASSIIGWFVLDLLLVSWIRHKAGKKIWEGGREHWHFRLFDAGLGKWQVLFVTLTLIGFTSYLGLTLPTVWKPIVWLFQALVILVIFWLTNRKVK